MIAVGPCQPQEQADQKPFVLSDHSYHLWQWRPWWQSWRCQSHLRWSRANHPGKHLRRESRRHRLRQHRSHPRISLHNHVNFDDYSAKVHDHSHLLGVLIHLCFFEKGPVKRSQPTKSTTVRKAPRELGKPDTNLPSNVGNSPFLTRNLYPLVHSLLLDAHRPQTGVTLSPNWGPGCQPISRSCETLTWVLGGGMTACTEGWSQGPEMSPKVMDSRPGIPRVHPRSCIIVLRHWALGGEGRDRTSMRNN